MPIKEWENEFNSFNSWKSIYYYPQYMAIKDWMNGKRKAPLAPIESSIDIIHSCNSDCQFCNAHRYLNEEKIPDGFRMSDKHLKKLIKFLAKWGVQGNCFGGGGNPTLHSGLKEALEYTVEVGMQPAVVDNGSIIYKDLKLAKTMVNTCRWIGISVDAATKETYKIGKNRDFFPDVLQSLELLCKLVKDYKVNCDIAFKFLLFDFNQHEAYEACKLAKKIGVHDFHIRPGSFTHQGMGGYKQNINPYDINSIKEQFIKCRKLEDENFHVYTVVHKFSDNFEPKQDFTQCYASPCCIQIMANGEVYLCPDQRFSKEFLLGTHFPDPKQILKFWGSEKHYDLVFKTGRKMCNQRCTFNSYCKQVEELFIKNTDPMCWRFI